MKNLIYAHLKDNFILIKIWIGTMPLKFLVSILRVGVIAKTVVYHTPLKKETSNFRGIVPIQFLINIKLSIKWALNESSPTKLTFLCIMGIFTFPRNFAEFREGVNFEIQSWFMHQNSCFDIVNHFWGGRVPIPKWINYPTP